MKEILQQLCYFPISISYGVIILELLLILPSNEYKTKRKIKKCRKKTIKKRDVTDIKKINRLYDSFIDKELNQKTKHELVKEFKSRVVLDYSSVIHRNQKYSYSYSINKADNYGKYYYIDNITNKQHILINNNS